MIQYYNEKDYETLESKKMILVFKKTLWFKNLKWWKSFSKECYTWKEDNGMFLIIEKPSYKTDSRGKRKLPLNQ